MTIASTISLALHPTPGMITITQQLKLLQHLTPGMITIAISPTPIIPTVCLRRLHPGGHYDRQHINDSGLSYVLDSVKQNLIDD